MALSISRRSFMKCVGITAFATATGTLMTGCAQGPITGNLGGANTLYDDNGPLLNITLTGLDWSPFDISLSDIGNALKVDLPGVDFNFSIISSLLGVGCAMPKGMIQNLTGKTVVILPYFTDDLLHEVIDGKIWPMLSTPETTEKIRVELENLLKKESDTIANALSEAIKKEAKKVGDWLVILLAVVEFANKLYPLENTVTASDMRHFLTNDGIITLIDTSSLKGRLALSALKATLSAALPQYKEEINSFDGKFYIDAISKWPDTFKLPILDAIREQLEAQVPTATDFVRLPMVHATVDGQTPSSDFDQALNAAAAGYALMKASRPLMIEPINSNETAIGALAFPAKRSWNECQMVFTTKKLDLSLVEGYPLDWDNVSTLLVEALIFMLYKSSAVPLADPLLNIIMDLFPTYLKYEISETGQPLPFHFKKGVSV